MQIGKEASGLRSFGARFAAAAILFVLVLAAAGRAPVIAAGKAGDPPDNSAASAVTIDNFSFSPAEVTVAAGTTVTWTNNDDIPHTVASVDKKFKSQALDTGDKFSFTFRDPGTYEYFCSIHPKMVGKIVVK